MAVENEGTAIVSIGTFVPDNLVTTEDMIAKLDKKLSADLKESLHNLSIKQRYSIVKNLSNYLAGNYPRELISNTTDLAVNAIKNCLEKVAYKKEDIGLLIAVTNTQNRLMPCLSYEIINELNQIIPNDINSLNLQNQGCSALLKAVDMAQSYLHNNPQKLVIIVASEAHSGLYSKKERAIYHSYTEVKNMDQQEKRATEDLVTSFLFGDGAIALLVGKANTDSKYTISHIVHLTNLDKEDSELLTMNEGGILIPEYSGYPIYHLNKNVPSRGIHYTAKCIDKLINQTDIDIKKLNFYCIHTGSKKILDLACKIFNLGPTDKKVETSYKILNNYANLSPCSIGFMIADHIQNKTVGKGVMLSFGVGFSASAGIIELNP